MCGVNYFKIHKSVAFDKIYTAIKIVITLRLAGIIKACRNASRPEALGEMRNPRAVWTYEVVSPY